MELKRILARDLRAATEKAVSLYGTDALVVSHEQVNGQTEVIVAVDLEPAFDRGSLELAEAEAHTLGASDAPNEPVVAEGAVGAANAINPDGPEFEAIFSQTLQPATKKREPVMGELRQDNHREQLRAREIVDIVRQEMAVLRRELRL